VFLPGASVRLLVQDKEGICSQYECKFSLVCITLIENHSQVEGLFYVNEHLKRLMYEELKHHSASQGWLCITAGFGYLPAIERLHVHSLLPWIINKKNVWRLEQR
jgi:hypothetical protein